MLTRKELIERWRIGATTIKRWEKSGRLPFVKMGEKLKRYRLSDVLELEGEMHVSAGGGTR